MIGSFKVVLALAMLSLFINITQANDNEVHRMYLTAYETMKSADYLKNKNLNADAADMYMEALRLYQQIAEKYPDWQPDLVAYRIDYCRKNLNPKDNTNPPIKAAQKESASQRDLPAGFGTNYNKVIVGPWRIEAKVREDNDDDNYAAPSEESAAKKNVKPISKEAEFNRIEELLVEARKAERAGDYVSALALYNSVLENKVSGEILKGALRSSIRVEDKFACRKFVELSKNSNILKDAELKYLCGLSYCIEGNFAQALGVLQEAALQDPTNPLIRVALGVAFAGCGKFAEAEAEMRKALSINSKIAEAYYNLAWIRLALKGKAAGGAMRADYQNALRYGADPDPILERNMP